MDFVAAFRERVATATREPGMAVEPMSSVTDTDGGSVPVRVYRPADGVLPLLVYVHGAGFIAGDLDSHDQICRYLAATVRAVVVAVDYRLAPEHPFPAALEDTVAAVEWALAGAADLGVDAGCWAIAGDSAGGTLAAAVAQRWRGRANAPRAQALICPALQLDELDHSSHHEFAAAAGFNTGVLRQMIDLYLGESADRSSPDASPARAPELSGLPPTVMITAELDPLRDDGESHARRLVECGVPVTSYRHLEMVHYGVLWCRAAEEIASGAAVVVDALRTALHETSSS